MSTTPKIFITGATGFIGAHTADIALKAGHNVRLSIRRAEQQQRLEKVFASHLSQIEFVVVPDITDAEDIRKALVGVDYIWHIASPMPTPGGDVRKHYVEPAVRGTIAVLEAAHTVETIKKVFIMSSVVALKPMGSFGTADTVTANTGEVLPVDLDAAFPEGFAGETSRYHASKILAHQAYREWVASHKPGFLTLSFHPVFVIGHDLFQERPEELAGVNGLFWQSLHSETPIMPSSLVDVRDVALAFARAFDKTEEKDKSGKDVVKSGTEYLLAGREVKWRDVVDFVKEKYPAVQVQINTSSPVVNRSGGSVDTKPAEEELALRWRSMEETVGAVIEQQLALKGQ